MTMRLHIISGERQKARTEAYTMQAEQPDENWMIVDASAGDGIGNHLASRNVIWVTYLRTEAHITSSHYVILPTTFGSSVLARLAADDPRRRFVLVGRLPDDPETHAWVDDEGRAHHPDALLDPVVSFVAEVA